MLAERGWRVLVLEAEDEPGGAVKSGELTEPGFTSDLFSAFYPLAVASPAIRSLELERHGLRWRRSPLAVAHPQEDGALRRRSRPTSTRPPRRSSASRRATATPGATSTPTGSAPAGRSSTRCCARSRPLRGAARLAAALGPRGLLRFAPLRRCCRSAGSPRSASAARAAAGCWPATRCTPTSRPSPPAAALFGWMLCGLGQQHGFPVPEGGAGRLTRALVERLRVPRRRRSSAACASRAC